MISPGSATAAISSRREQVRRASRRRYRGCRRRCRRRKPRPGPRRRRSSTIAGLAAGHSRGSSPARRARDNGRAALRRSVSGPLCLTTPSSVSQVRLRPSKSDSGAPARSPRARSGRCDRSRRRRARQSSSASSPAWPNGGWPRSWASATASARSSSRPSARGQRAGDLRHFQRVGQPGAVMIALVEHEDLGLVLQAAEGGGMDDAVAVAAKRRCGLAGRLRMKPPAAFSRIAGIGRAAYRGVDRHGYAQLAFAD